MYSICQTTHPASTVEHSLECNFYNLQETNLIVAGANQLSVYRIIGKLFEFIQSFELYGNVASLQKIRFGTHYTCKRDSLVLSFNDAKLSIVEYNPETHNLKTVSMHYFEDDELREGRAVNHLNPPIVRVDPENRCIAMLVYGRHVVIVPIEKDEEDLEHDLYNTSSSSSSEDESMNPYDANENQDGSFDKSSSRGQVVPSRALANASSQYKCPVLPSHKMDLSEETCGERITNIADIQFLHNYNDPTLVILYEPTRTWSGRVAMRQDTFSMIAFSLDVHQRLQPIIWTVNNLPYDSLRLLPVPKPFGGLLIIACNELIYLNQSVPPFAMSFNCFTQDSSSFPIDKGAEPVSADSDKKDFLKISLDLSQAVFLNQNRILFILKDGDVYLVTLFNDDMRTIKDFRFERIASTVQPNCLTLLDNNLLFIGSHVGDSVLAEIVGDMRDDHMDAYDDDTDSLISNEEREPMNLYEHDQLLSLSSSGRICYGEAANISDNLHYNYKDPHVELVMTSGHHKNGAVCVLQKTIKPNVEDTYELKTCGDLWCLKPSKWENADESRLLLNRDYETMVFSTKGELLEIKREECPFETNEPTVFATNIGPDNMSLQVMSKAVYLISNGKMIESVKIDGAKIIDACFAEPHLVVLTKVGSLHHIQLHLNNTTGTEDGCNLETGAADDQPQYSLSCQDLPQLTDGGVIAIDLYKDTSGLFTCSATPQQPSNIGNSNDIKESYWLFVVEDRGVLEIFEFPKFNLVYSVDNFPVAPSVLCDNIKLFVTDVDTTISKTEEILVVGLGRDNKRPLLFVRSKSELVVYEVFRFVEVEIPNHLKIRFKKISSHLMTTIVPTDYDLDYLEDEPMLAITDGHSQMMTTHDYNGNGSGGMTAHSSSSHNHHDRSSSSRSKSKLPDLRERWLLRRHWLREFRGINGFNGVFVAGFKPQWFFMTDRCELRNHPMNAEGSIYAFSQYNKDSFIYFTENRELRISRLPKHLMLDCHWPMRKLYVKETVHFVNYHVDRKVYCVVTSQPKPCLKIMKVGNEPDTMKIEELDRECGYIPATTERFRLRLYDPENWVEIPDCEIEFEEWEQVTCVRNVMLASEGTKSGLKGYIALSTNYCYGEDVPNRGRIWILDLIEVVPEPDKPLTRNKIKTVYCGEQKGPVTTISYSCGLLMSAVGQKIYLWQLKEGNLDGVAFIDTQVYIHCAASVKNLILVSDVCKSVTLLRYQQETRTLSMVCRDPRPSEVFACDFMIDNELLNFIVADSERNILVYAHDPQHEDSHGATRLVRRSDFHLGSHVIGFSRLRAKVPSLFVNDPNESHYCRRKHITMFCTVDGAIGFLLPIHESIYDQFNRLQNEMTVALPHAAGLNPKAWRLVQQSRPSIASPCRGIVDGDLIRRYLMLSVKERNEFAKKIGTTADKILADIQLVQEATLYF